MKALKVLGLSLMMLVGVAEAKIANPSASPSLNLKKPMVQEFVLTKNRNTFAFALSDERDLHKMSIAELKKERDKTLAYLQTDINTMKLRNISNAKFYFLNNVNSGIEVLDIDGKLYRQVESIYHEVVGLTYRLLLTNALIVTKEDKVAITFDDIENAKARAAKYALAKMYNATEKKFHAELCTLGYNYGVLETQLCSDNYFFTKDKNSEWTFARHEEGFYNNLKTVYDVHSLKYRHYSPMSHSDEAAKYVLNNLSEKTFSPFMKNGLSPEYTYKNGIWVLKKLQNTANKKSVKNNS